MLAREEVWREAEEAGKTLKGGRMGTR